MKDLNNPFLYRPLLQEIQELYSTDSFIVDELNLLEIDIQTSKDSLPKDTTHYFNLLQYERVKKANRASQRKYYQWVWEYV